MDEEFSVDPSQLLEAASDFARQPGALSDASAQEFLTRFPLPSIIRLISVPSLFYTPVQFALQTNSDFPGLEDALVDCLERIFRTKYGASLIPQYMPFVLVGLGAGSQKVRRLACVAVLCLLEKIDKWIAVQLVLQHGIYPLLLGCLIDGDEQVAAASTDAIKFLAGYPEGMGIVFPASANEATHLGNLAANCSSLGRVRVLALIVRLFSISSSVASELSRSNLLSLLEAEVRNTNDTLVTLSVLELLYEYFGGSPTQCRVLVKNQPSSAPWFDNQGVRTVLSAIDKRFEFMESQETDECECALEALGQIGSSFQGAKIVLSTAPPIARRVVDAAFDRQQHGKQLAALHSLGNIAGETRMGNTVMLNSIAEENLRSLIYDKASKTSKLTPSGLLLSVLQQDSEIRIAGYRLVSGLVARPWCLMEIVSRVEIIDILTNRYTETSKIGMEARHRCCEAIYRMFASSTELISDPSFADIASKLGDAIRRGPYGARKLTEAQPAVITADRF
ncbi:hypothetical protein OROMI_017403 [Orobanche minor]